MRVEPTIAPMECPHCFFLFLCSSAIFFPPPHVESLYDLIWLVGVNDFILKFVCVIIKVFLVLVPMRYMPYQKRVSVFEC